MIFALLITPLIGVLLLLLEPSFYQYNTSLQVSKERIKRIALLASLINFFISIILWFQFDPNSANYQFVSDFGSLISPSAAASASQGQADGAGVSSHSLNFCHFHVGIDGISLYFVLLTTFITPICILSNWTDIQIKLKYFLISFLVLETLQIAVFVVLDLFLFYVFFESVLIPLFFIVIIWGGSEKKYRAAFLLFLYTLAGSLFMLLAILFIYQNTGSTDFLVLSLYDFNLEYQKILWLAFFISFAVKTPLFPFHIWLFRAHAEAPLAGSIILAAVILKLATYGFLRVSIPLFSDACLYFLPLVQTIAALTIIYASLSTLRQIDSKQLVAMSSVAHMGVVILAIFSNNIQGIEGGILLGVSHGFVSPALFICVGGIIYSRFHTRIIIYFKGLVNRMPLFVTLFFVFTLFNTAIPLSLNYIGEFLSLTGVYLQSPFIAVLGASGIVFSAGYSVWLFTKISYGSYSSSIEYLSGIMKDINRREFFLLLPLLLSTIVLGIFPNILLNDLHTSVSYNIYNILSSSEPIGSGSLLTLSTVGCYARGGLIKHAGSFFIINFRNLKKYSRLSMPAGSSKHVAALLTLCRPYRGVFLIFDLVLFYLVIYFFFYDILILMSHIVDSLQAINNKFYGFDSIICNMSSSSGGNTNTVIVHSNDGWAQGIKSIFIYGTGALRLHLLRGGGNPVQRSFIIASTVAADVASTAIKNAINDPEYVEKHINSWSRIFKGENNSTLEINVDKDSEILAKLKEVKSKLLPDNFEDFSDKLINSLINILKPILEPVTVDYSQELLANQIYGISILLFILSVLILILLLGFMINIIILVYSDKLMNLFTNKYIRWYINFNKKIIGIEICFLGGSIIYFMYMLSYGIHFIATHPIII